jgi:hypothetical protein
LSSKPHQAGARRALALIDEIAANDTVIDERRKSVAILRTAEERADQLGRELADLLRSMDVESVGNAGYGGRTAWLLTEVVRLVRGQS